MHADKRPVGIFPPGVLLRPYEDPFNHFHAHAHALGFPFTEPPRYVQRHAEGNELITAPLVILGQVFAASFAAGLNLYLTVALVGLTSRLGLIPSLPPGLEGLENTVLISSAALLYILEFFVDKIPQADSVWDALHTFIRPVAAGLLAALALDTAPLYWQIGIGLIGGVVALAAHGTKAGLRIILNTRVRRRWATTVISTIEDLVAAAAAIAALAFPIAALIGGTVFTAILIVAGPRLWRAGALAVRALRARLRGFFGTRSWRPFAEVPLVLRSLVTPTPLGQAEPRAIRAAATGLRGVGSYRNGWLVISCEGASFLYRSLGRPRKLALEPLRPVRIQKGLLADTLHLEDERKRGCTLFLLKDGPSADTALADLITTLD